METVEIEVQDTSCRGSGGVPQLQKSPKIGGYRGLIDTISAVPKNICIDERWCVGSMNAWHSNFRSDHEPDFKDLTGQQIY